MEKENTIHNGSKKIVLSIQGAEEPSRIKLSNEYQVKLNDWELGRNVLGIDLQMEAGKRPELTLKLHLDEIEINGVDFKTLKANCQK